MTIAIHINNRDDVFRHVFNSFVNAATNHPDDHFIFISDDASLIEKSLPKNCTPVQLGPEIKNGLVRYYWYNYKIPSVLNRYHADVLFTPREVCSLSTRVPQIMLLSEVKAIRGGRRAQLRKKYSDTAFRIGTFERDVYDRARKFFPEKKLFLNLHGLSNEGGTRSGDAGDPYFAAVITKNNRHEVTTLLKAFSLFKKWQRSSYKLVLVLRYRDDSDPVPNFSSYKYKSDVKLCRPVKSIDLIEVLANAFTVVQLYSVAEGSRMELEAMRDGVPVISTCEEKGRGNNLSESALYAKNTAEGIAEQLMRIYKDESLYGELSERSRQFTMAFNWHSSAETLYSIAEEAVRQRL